LKLLGEKTMTGVGTKTTIEPGRWEMTLFVVRRGKIPLLLAASIALLENNRTNRSVGF